MAGGARRKRAYAARAARRNGAQGPAIVRRARRGGDLPCRSGALRLHAPAAVAPFPRAAIAEHRIGPGRASLRGHGEGGSPRHPQDARLRALPAARRGAARTLRRLVRARTPHRRAQCRLLRSPLYRHALDHPDAPRLGRLGRRAVGHRPRGAPRRCAARRRRRGALEDLFRQHLQPGAAEGEGHAGRDAEEILAEPSRGFAHSRPDCRRRREVTGDDRAHAHHARSAPCQGPGQALARAGNAGDARRRRRRPHHRGAAPGRGGLPPLPALARRHADRVRRRSRIRPGWCSSASSRATRRTSPASRS